MNEARERLFATWTAFDHPVVVWVTIGLAVLLGTTFLVARILYTTKRIDKATYAGFFVRWRSWLWLVLAMLTPILLGAAWVMLGVLVLSLLCFREYARVTGLFREKTISAVVVFGILVVAFTAVDHFVRMFFATAALTCGLIAVVTLPQDRPKGYIQRVALGMLGFVLLGYSFGYLSIIANDANYRPLLVLILLAVGMNDLFTRVGGQVLGGPRLLPNTSPGRTVAGVMVALVLTTALVVLLGHFIFLETEMDRIDRLILLGAMISVLGQLGGCVLSAIKRDVEVKDTGALLPGHGGLLDRYDSLVLVPPAVYHLLSLVLGPIGGPAQRLFTGSP